MSEPRLDVAGGLIQHEVALAPLTTYRFGGSARHYAEVHDEGELRSVVAARIERRLPAVFILGRGSNVVVSDDGYDGLVVRLSGEFLEVDVATDGAVTAGGGVSLAKLARQSVAAGRGGLEWYIGIPGSVGGAVKMNAGGHGGGDTAKWLVSADIFDMAAGAIDTRSAAELGLGYRVSDVRDTDVVVRATFRTSDSSPDEGRSRMREITRWRRDNQPGGSLNAGSVFKNPQTGPTAGEIIDGLGLKGYQRGSAFVSRRHANFFEAEKGATAQDVFDLVRAVQHRVVAANGILLEPEIKFLGAFHSLESESEAGLA